LHQLVGRIEKALDAKQYALGVFFDIEGAFDNTSPMAVKQTLRERGIHKSLIDWIVLLISMRTVTVRTDLTNIMALVRRGLPQGGGLSPTLWSLIADSLLKWLTQQGIFAQGYADDGVALVVGNILSTICDIMQGILNGVERWCQQMQLSINPEKTEFILFTRRYKPDDVKDIKFYGKSLMLTKQVKYLGVLLDHKLSFKNHVEHKCRKAIMAFHQVRRCTGKIWGYSPRIVHWLYTMVIRPMFTYAAVIWWPRVNFITVRKSLEHVQRLACLYTTGAIRTTPTVALELIVGLVPLPVFVQQEAMNTCYRLAVNRQWKQGTCGHTRINSLVKDSVPFSHTRCDLILPRYVFGRNYCVHIPMREEWTSNKVSIPDDIVCYTDGSKMGNTGSTGAGIYNHANGDECVLPLGKYATVYQAEVYAILLCAVRLQNEVDQSICICSDSQGALKALSAVKITSRLVSETVDALQVLSIHNGVRLLWVPGHCNIVGNERADQLAKQAAETDFTGPEPAVGLSVDSVRLLVHRWAIKEQIKLWQQHPGCRQGKLLLQRYNRGLTRYAIGLGRRDLRILVGLLTGHNWLNRHMSVMGIRDNPKCPLCDEEDETSLHLLGKCPATMARRNALLGAFQLNPVDLRGIHWSILLKFAKTSGRF
jgi:ribonuclease HI